jgi:DNA-binding phage protein
LSTDSQYDGSTPGNSFPSIPSIDDVKDAALEAHQIREEQGYGESLWHVRRDLQETASAYLTAELGMERDMAQEHASEVAFEAGMNGAHIYDALEKRDAWSSMENISEQNQGFSYSDGVWLC